MNNSDKYYIDERVGKEGTTVRLLALSRSVSNPDSIIASFECEYWRAIHSELKTHRLLSSNSSSSRAVNKDAMRDQAINNIAYPVFWGLNKSGMQASEEHDNVDLCKKQWDHARDELVFLYDNLSKLGLHKQIVNRILESVTKIKTVITATEFDNMFYLRLQDDVEPNMRELVELMHDLIKTSQDEAEWLESGQWHTPYVKHGNIDDKFVYLVDDEVVDLETALAVSTSCCAQVSYRNIDYSKEKAMRIYDKLHIGTTKGHHSPTEHQATPMENPTNDFFEDKLWEAGVTHMDAESQYWSGNFKGWIQHRQLIPNNACHNYEKTVMEG